MDRFHVKEDAKPIGTGDAYGGPASKTRACRPFGTIIHDKKYARKITMLMKCNRGLGARDDVRTYNIEEVSKLMRDVEFVMFFTKSEEGELSGRPMSNNGEVDYDAESYFFAYDTTQTVRDIVREPAVALSYQGCPVRIGQAPILIAVAGQAILLRDRRIFAAVWSKDLDRWFPNGPETPGLVMINVTATRVRFWEGADGGEVALTP